MKRSTQFLAVHTEGGLLPADLLARIAAGDKALEGLTPEGYHLGPTERLNEAINRSWSRLLGAWMGFEAALAGLSPSDTSATGLTRQRWSLLLFQELGFGQLQPARARDVDGKAYPVSHAWGRVPIHLVGARIDLERPTRGVAGAARMSPHGMMQELLNRSDDFLWGFVSNGLRLRLLRDNASLTRQAYVEFDLEAMLTGQSYSDFVVLWLVCHQSRVEGDVPEKFLLERWAQEAAQQGTRALEHLRGAVEAAIAALGEGFIAHPANVDLRERLCSGQLDKQEYYRQLLRVVYRLLFLCVAESRDLLAPPGADPTAKERYRRFYSLDRLRRLSDTRRGANHGDLWAGLQIVVTALGHEDGCPALALPPLGSFLWSAQAVTDLGTASLANRYLLDAIRALSSTREGKIIRSVDYRNLGAEELGSVYESLLELHPDLDVVARHFTLTTASGNERKLLGSYYTPTSLITELLNSALEPVLAEAAAQPDPELAILRLKVLDPACGSGHFLIAAAHRIARRLAAVRTGEEEPSPVATRTALRDVIGHCIYGVDVNEMAVELCKVSLWMEALEPGKPLSFLDHRIACGDALLGTTPALLAAGIPDSAFKPIEGDDKKVVSALRVRNVRERSGQGSLALEFGVGDLQAPLAAEMAAIDALADASIAGIREKEQRFTRLQSSPAAAHAKLVADAWCSAFVGRKAEDAPNPITEGVVWRLRSNPQSAGQGLQYEVERLAAQYKFLHWHLAFPDVFRVPTEDEEPTNAQTGWSGGFDLVLGNPPWERVKLQEKEWFAGPRPDIAAASNAATRRRMIASLEQEDPPLYSAFLDARRQAEGESHIVRNSGRYPLCGRGDVNTYAVFAEGMRSVLSPVGRAGVIVPSGIATDDTTKHFFADIVERGSLVSLYDFENAAPLFPDVDRRYKFCLLTLSGPARPIEGGAEFVFFAHSTTDLRDEERRFTLSAEDLALLNPNTRTCPVFRSKRDAELTKSIYRRVPILVSEGPPPNSPWGASFMRMFDMTNDAHLFRTFTQLEAAGWTLEGNIFHRGSETYSPLYEAKMAAPYDHRAARVVISPTAVARQGQPEDLTQEEHEDPSCLPLPRSWVPGAEVQSRLEGAGRHWLIGWRNVTSPTNERTLMSFLLPVCGVGNSAPLLLPSMEHTSVMAGMVGSLASFCLDFVARQKLGGVNLNFFIVEQLPLLAPKLYGEMCPWAPSLTVGGWLRNLVLELVYTAWDLASFGADLGYNGAPFRWAPERRPRLRAEIDAAFFHLYGIGRDDIGHIMDTFLITKRKDEALHGEFLTKDLILQCYDAMAKAAATGELYQTILDPPPADPRVAHPARSGAVEPSRRLSLVTEPPDEDRYRTCVPVYSLKAAAGSFGNVQEVQDDGWVEIPDHRLRPGMFVAQVVGHSMEPRISDGAWCLFRSNVEGSREGKTLLVQHHDISDPETGGSYTVKRYHSEKVASADGSWSHARIRLEPTNSEYDPIELTPTDEGDVAVVAELIDVFPPDAIDDRLMGRWADPMNGSPGRGCE
jgi:SOS-response transcriptional repressor LexA